MTWLFSSLLLLAICNGVRSENGTLVQLAKLRAPWNNCTVNQDCPSNALCFMGKVCQCNHGYIEKNNANGPMHCLRVASRIGDQCEDEIQCEVAFGRWSECYRGVDSDTIGQCQCRKNTQFREGLCFSKSYIGERCIVSDHCYIDSQENGTIAHCFEGKCICPLDYHPSKDKRDCVKDAVYGAPCKGNYDCISDQTECIHEQCRCKVKYVVSNDRKKCLPVAEVLTDSCSEDQQCTEYLENTMCDQRNKVCHCIPTAHQVNEQCLPDVQLMGLCDNKFECLIPSLNYSIVECHEGRCSCAQGFKMSPSKEDCLEDSSSSFTVRTSMSLLTVLFLLMRQL